MSDKQKEPFEEKLSALVVNISDDKVDITEQSATFEEIYNSFKEIEPDFPEEYARKAFEYSLARQNGEVRGKDFEPEGRFAHDVMEPVFKAIEEIKEKDMELFWQKQFANKKLVLGYMPIDGSGEMEKIKLPYPELAETLRETNPDLTDRQLDLSLDFAIAYMQRELNPDLFEKGAYFDREILDPALKEFFKALNNEKKYLEIKEEYQL